MKVCRAICCLSLSVCCTPLFGQKLLSDASPRPAFAPAETVPVLSNAEVKISATRSRVAAPSTYSYLPMFGLAAESDWAQSWPLQSEALVCTQPLSRAATDRPSDYAFGRLQFNSAAIKGTFAHDNLVKMARNFDFNRPLPDAPSYIPLTKRQKFDMFLRNVHSMDMGFSILADSLIAQASGAYPSFGGGMEGYGRRLGAATAGEESAAFFSGFVFPTLLHQDPRYFRSHQDAISDRLAYAASRVLIGRSDSGHNVVNLSAIMSQFVQAAVSNAYIPYRNETVPGTLENGVAGLAAVAQANILNEFWPDIKEFFSRHNPESLVVHKKSPSADAMLASRQ